MKNSEQISSCRNCGDQLRTALEVNPKGVTGRVFPRLTAQVKCINCDQQVQGGSVEQAVELWNQDQQEETP